MSAAVAQLGLAAYILLSSLLVYSFPRSVSAFLLFEASLLLIYYAPVARAAKLASAAAVLVVVMPLIGTMDGYYLEVAIQVGIFAALALGLNIVVGFVGLLNLGFVAFYAIGAYLWAIFGSQQANEFLAGGHFPLAPAWFFVFLLLSIAAMIAARRIIVLLAALEGPRCSGRRAAVSRPPWVSSGPLV